MQDLIEAEIVSVVSRGGPIEGMPATATGYSPEQRATRLTEMQQWRDPADVTRGFRDHELDGAVDFESNTGIMLRGNDPGVPGDFTGADNDIVYDHFGIPERAFTAQQHNRPRLIEQFKQSLTSHVDKLAFGVDELIADLNNFTPTEIAAIKQYAIDNHPTLVDKINYIND